MPSEVSHRTSVRKKIRAVLRTRNLRDVDRIRLNSTLHPELPGAQMLNAAATVSKQDRLADGCIGEEMDFQVDAELFHMPTALLFPAYLGR